MGLLTTDLSSTVTSKGQVTIPLLLRQQFQLQAGDKVSFFTKKKSLHLQPQKKLTLKDLAGSVPPLKRRLTDKQIHDIAWEDKLNAFR